PAHRRGPRTLGAHPLPAGPHRPGRGHPPRGRGLRPLAPTPPRSHGALVTTDVAAVAALTLYLAGLAAAFGARSWIHRRRTGSAGFRGLSGAPGSAEWWGGILFAGALVLGAARPALVLTGTSAPLALPPAVQWAGLAVAISGFGGVLVAQAGMGSSWRIGVDTTERTGLVTSGMFAVVRNPIFTAMLTAMLGLPLLVPTGVTARPEERR